MKFCLGYVKGWLQQLRNTSEVPDVRIRKRSSLLLAVATECGAMMGTLDRQLSEAGLALGVSTRSL
jgi:hypothetical protein